MIKLNFKDVIVGIDTNNLVITVIGAIRADDLNNILIKAWNRDTTLITYPLPYGCTQTINGMEFVGTNGWTIDGTDVYGQVVMEYTELYKKDSYE